VAEPNIEEEAAAVAADTVGKQPRLSRTSQHLGDHE
jgi:hypothetical protein